MRAIWARRRDWACLLFWILAFLLLLLVSGSIAYALSRRAAPAPSRAAHDVEVYGAQLRELQGDLERGLIPPDQVAAARAEIGRRLLKANAELETGERAAMGQKGARAAALPLVVVLAFAVGSTVLYARLGRPNQPDLPLEARLSVDPAKADIATLVAQVERRLKARPDDGRGWDMLLPIYLDMGRSRDAVTAADNAIRLLGPTAIREAMRGEALVGAAGGQVTAPAREAFETALRLEPATPAARFYLALGLSQDKRFAEARDAWRAVLDKGPPDAPWMAAARGALDDAERQLAEAPGAAPKGPTAADIAAAQDLSPRDRDAMIEGMVSQLEARLKSAPNDPDGWKRLIRSYTVLGDASRAGRALEDARGAFPDGSADRRSIEDFAASLKLGGTGTTQ